MFSLRCWHSSVRCALASSGGRGVHSRAALIDSIFSTSPQPWIFRELTKKFDFRPPTMDDLPKILATCETFVGYEPFLKALNITADEFLPHYEWIAKRAILQPAYLKLSMAAFNKETGEIDGLRLSTLRYRKDENDPVLPLIPKPPMSTKAEIVLDVLEDTHRRVWKHLPREPKLLHGIILYINPSALHTGLAKVIEDYDLQYDKLRKEHKVRYGFYEITNKEMLHFSSHYGYQLLEEAHQVLDEHGHPVPLDINRVLLVHRDFERYPPYDAKPVWESEGLI